MEKLTDFKPLARVELPGLGQFDCSGLILVVGPNSSGKTHLLRDLYGAVTGEARDPVVVRKIVVERPADFESFMHCLENDGYVELWRDPTGQKYYRPKVPVVGMGKSGSHLDPGQAQSYFGQIAQGDMGSRHKSVIGMEWFGQFLAKALFLDRRLISTNEVSSFDYVTSWPQNDLHALHLDDQAKSELENEIRRAFSLTVWLDTSRGQFFTIKVSEEPEKPSAEDRHSPAKMMNYRSIDSEGDGLKSYVATCIALLLGRHPLCLIDEPEMCLHPPQAFYLGQFIGRFGAADDTATFVSTHSSHLLRGVVQATSSVSIIRLAKSEGKFKAHLVSPALLAETLRKPTVRAETVLDGIFSERVLIVEADGDRIVYQAAWESLREEFGIEVHIAAVGGTGGLADACKLYKTLEIPTAIIADLDVVTDSQKLRNMLDNLSDRETVNRICDLAHKFADKIKQLPPTISEIEVKTKLKELSARNFDWSNDDDVDLRRELGRLGSDVRRLSKLKRGGIFELPTPLQQDLGDILNSCDAVGLFLVPVGELEGWLKDFDFESSRRRKWMWANEAASLIDITSPQNSDLWEFIRKVGRFLT